MNNNETKYITVNGPNSSTKNIILLLIRVNEK